MITPTIGTPFQQSLIESNGSVQQEAPKDELGKEDFLTLLVTQLKHQDPLNPMESVEFTAQLAQFSSLEQLFGVNESLSSIQNSLISQEDGNLLDYIGKAVKTNDDRITLEDGAAESGVYTLEGQADVSVFVSDGNGTVVRKLEEGEREAGEHPFQWDGRDDSGQALNNGIYTFTVQAKDGAGASVFSQAYAGGMVTGVAYDNTTPYLMVGNKRVSPEDIVAVTQPGNPDL